MLGRQRPEILTSSISKLLSNPTSCSYEVPSENAVLTELCHLPIPTSTSVGSAQVIGIIYLDSADENLLELGATPQFSGPTSTSVGSAQVIGIVHPDNTSGRSTTVPRNTTQRGPHLPGPSLVCAVLSRSRNSA